MTRTLPTLLAIALAVGCARRAASPPPASPGADATGDATRLQPPPLPAGAQAGPTDARGARAELRRQIFTAAWSTIRDKHYDKTLGGQDWNALRARYEPLAVGAPDEPSFYRFLNEMLGQLGQSHLEVTGPGAEPLPLPDEPAPAREPAEPVLAVGGVGDPGLTVRVIEDQPTISAVRPGSSAARAGLRPGLVVTHIGGRDLRALPRPTRALRPVEERYQLRLHAARRLAGPAGTKVTVRYLDARDQPAEVMLERDPPRGRAVQFGLLPPIHPEVRVSQVGEVGVIAFNFFLLQPVLADVQKAIDGFRARGARALVLDLRGNPGGIGAMAIPVAARLVARPIVLGTFQYREHTQTLSVEPPLGVKPFGGRVVLLTDEGTASTSEILAAGLQEAGRALVVGDATLGAALPSAIEELPGGAVMQYPVADFRTPKGVLLEGRGVQPDRRVLETRAALRSGRDPVLDAALVAARASTPR